MTRDFDRKYGATRLSDYRNSHANRGLDYAARFRERRYRSAMWDMEKAVLDDLITRYISSSNSSILDFACGTGRILNHVAPYAGRIVGVDVSSNMLSVARSDLPDNARLINADLSVDCSQIDGEKFDLITAFRFFPNAENALRDQAMSALSNLLKPDGILIVNNHQNSTSPMRKIGAALRLMRARNMSTRELDILLNRYSLKSIEHAGLGLLPLHDHFMPLPVGIVKKSEFYWRYTSLAVKYAQNIITVASRQ